MVLLDELRYSEEKEETLFDAFIHLVLNNKEWLFSGVGVLAISWVGRHFYKQRQTTSSQKILSGNNSTNLQSGRDINFGTRKKGDDVEE